MKDYFTAIDLFCGAGGLSCGLQQAGFSVLLGNDIDAVAGASFSIHHNNAHFLHKEIQNISGAELLRLAKLKRGELDCLVGGPPCQAFSVYNHQRGMHDDRGHLFKDYLRIVKALNPRWILMENVTGILSVDDGIAVQAILSGLKKLGYKTEYKILKAEDYGVPQERRRIVFIGNRENKEIIWPEKTHGDKFPFTTIKDAIGDLPVIANGEGAELMEYQAKAFSSYQRMLRKWSKVVVNHSAPRLGEMNLRRLKHIPQGGSWRDIPVKLLPDGMKKANRSDHTKRYGRMSWDGLSCTVLTKCDPHWGAFFHPEQDRSITVREAARIQSFPDKFTFYGSRTEQYIQVGNAVPPLLGLRLGEAILSADGVGSDDLEQISVNG